MDSVTALMASQVAVERGADVVKLVEQSNEFVVEVLIEEARQTESHHVKHFLTADKIALHLVRNASSPARQVTFMKTQRRQPCLQAMRPPRAGLSDGKQQAGNVHMAQRLAAQRDVRTQALDLPTKVEWSSRRS